MILFSIKCFTKVHNIDFKPDKSLHGWGEFKEYLKIRNQLMHPKSADDLHLNNKKLNSALQSAIWFKETLTSMFEQCASRQNILF